MKSTPTVIARDRVSESQVAALAATLDHREAPWTRNELPPLGHWTCFRPSTIQSDIGSDGHPRVGDDVIEGMRRMWASSEVDFFERIPIESEIIRRTSTISVQPKTGRSGNLTFVSLLHEIESDGQLAIRETQNLVYREHTQGIATGEQAPRGEWQRSLVPDETLLMRYSALTFNAHRIHYDLPYCKEIEGYPALVVHGPLTATLLMDAFLRRHPQTVPRKFTFRAVRPAFCGEALDLCGLTIEGGVEMSAINPQGLLVMTAKLDLVK